MSFKIRDEHWEVLLSFFEINREMASGHLKCLNSRQQNKKLWQELAVKLNSLGFGERTADKWQKTWTDLKYLLKKKGSNIREDQQKTGGGLGSTLPFNSFEMRALNVLGGDSFFLGVGSNELGIKKQSGKPSYQSSLKKIPFRCEKSRTLTNNLITAENIENMPPGSSKFEDCNSIECIIEESDKNISCLVKPAENVLNTNKRPRPVDDNEHNYSVPWSKKKKTTSDNMDDVYHETITVLKDIKNVIETKLTEISCSINRLTNAINNKSRDKYV